MASSLNCVGTVQLSNGRVPRRANSLLTTTHLTSRTYFLLPSPHLLQSRIHDPSSYLPAATPTHEAADDSIPGSLRGVGVMLANLLRMSPWGQLRPSNDVRSDGSFP